VVEIRPPPGGGVSPAGHLKPMEKRGQWFQDPREIGVQHPELGCIF